MDELEGLELVRGLVPGAGDDAAYVDGAVLTTDMLHESTDFPTGTTRYTAGWRTVGVSLSDLAAMGAIPTAAVAIYAAPAFDEAELTAFIEGAIDVCELVECEYAGGDLDQHAEFTVASTALGATDDPVLRSGARPGDRVCVTGRLGRTAAAMELFAAGEHEQANDLFRFTPRISAGRSLAGHATAMIDASDGLVRSVHQIAAASGCGIAIESADIPIYDLLIERGSPDNVLDLAVSFGEDFELVATVPPDELSAARERSPVDLTTVGRIVEPSRGISMDGETLPDRGYTHAENGE